MDVIDLFIYILTYDNMALSSSSLLTVILSPTSSSSKRHGSILILKLFFKIIKHKQLSTTHEAFKAKHIFYRKIDWFRGKRLAYCRKYTQLEQKVRHGELFTKLLMQLIPYYENLQRKVILSHSFWNCTHHFEEQNERKAAIMLKMFGCHECKEIR